MSESLIRPSWLRSRSHVPGSFNTEDELSPIKTSFDLDSTHQALQSESASPRGPLHSDDNSLPLPEHSDMSVESFGGGTMDGTDDKNLDEVSDDSSLSMIASSTASDIEPAGAQSITGASLPVDENGLRVPPRQIRVDGDSITKSTTLSEDPATYKALASSSPTLSSELATLPSTLEARTFDSSAITQIHQHSPASLETITTAPVRRSASSHTITSPTTPTTPITQIHRYRNTTTHAIVSPSTPTVQVHHTISDSATKSSLPAFIKLVKMFGLLKPHQLDRIIDRLVRKYVPVPHDPDYYDEADNNSEWSSMYCQSVESDLVLTEDETSRADHKPSTPNPPKAESVSEFVPDDEADSLIDNFLCLTYPSESESEQPQITDNHELSHIYSASNVSRASPSRVSEVSHQSSYHSYIPIFDRPMSALGIRDHCATFDQLTKDNFDLKMKISYLQKMINEVDDEGVRLLLTENTELKTNKIRMLQTSKRLNKTIRSLETQIKNADNDANRLRKEHRTTVTGNKNRIIELEQELVETQTEVTELHRKIQGTRGRSNSQKEAAIRQLSAANEALIHEVRAQTLMLTSRNNERDLLTAQVEELKLAIGSRRSGSNGSRLSESERNHYEDRIGSLSDEVFAFKLAEHKTAKKLQAKRSECDELHAMVEHLDELLDKKGEEIKTLDGKVKSLEEEREKLRNEVRMLDNNMAHVEADCQAKIRRVQELESENEDISHELESIEKALVDANGENQKLAIELESRHIECTFLREEQDSTMLKIGALEASLKTTETNLASETERATDADSHLAETLLEIGALEASLKTIKTDLTSETKRATEAESHLADLQNSTTLTIGALEASLKTTKTGLTSETKRATKAETHLTDLQKNMDEANHDLDQLRTTMSDNEALLKTRTALMETNVLETRHLNEQLEKERQLRRQDKAQHDQSTRTQQHTTRTITQKDTRITELETARNNIRKQLTTSEQVHKDQIAERNHLLLALWHRLSPCCGTDWQHQNNLINGHLPTFDVVNNMLPAFGKHLMSAVRYIEQAKTTFDRRILRTEAAFARDFEALERNMDMKSRRIERIEGHVNTWNTCHGHAPGSVSSDHGHSNGGPSYTRLPIRHHSTTEIETLERGKGKEVPNTHGFPISISSTLEPSAPGEQRWIHRLRELERRLKAEREGRLLDRSAARDRLEIEKALVEALRKELERVGGRNH